MLDADAAKYFQGYLGKKLYRRNSDASIIWFNQSILQVINESPIMANSYSKSVQGIGDLNDLRLEAHDEAYYNKLKNEAPFWREKAEEVDNLGYFKFAISLRLMADAMEMSDDC